MHIFIGPHFNIHYFLFQCSLHMGYDVNWMYRFFCSRPKSYTYDFTAQKLKPVSSRLLSCCSVAPALHDPQGHCHCARADTLDPFFRSNLGFSPSPPLPAVSFLSVSQLFCHIQECSIDVWKGGRWTIANKASDMRQKGFKQRHEWRRDYRVTDELVTCRSANLYIFIYKNNIIIAS